MFLRGRDHHWRLPEVREGFLEEEPMMPLLERVSWVLLHEYQEPETLVSLLSFLFLVTCKAGNVICIL